MAEIDWRIFFPFGFKRFGSFRALAPTLLTPASFIAEILVPFIHIIYFEIREVYSNILIIKVSAIVKDTKKE